jgi:heme-degrading monooxygenase HmoA
VVRRSLNAQGDEVTTGPFVYMWSYDVALEHRDAFRVLYGPEGPWIALFRQAPGYLDTQLLVDLDEVGRFVTIDRWESKETFVRFRSDFAEEFDVLDARGEALTSREVLLGEFGPVDRETA